MNRTRMMHLRLIEVLLFLYAVGVWFGDGIPGLGPALRPGRLLFPVLLVVCAVAGGSEVVRRLIGTTPPLGYRVAFIVIPVAIICSLQGAVDVPRVLSSLEQFLHAPLLLAAMLIARSRSAVNATMQGLWAGLTITTFFGLLAFTGLPLPWADGMAYDAHRYKFFMQHPNQVGIIVTATLPLWVYWFGLTRRRAQGGSAVGMSVLVLALSGAKANMILSAIGLAMMFVVLLRAANRNRAVAARTLIAALFVGLGLWGGWTLIASELPQTASSLRLLAEQGDTHSIQERRLLWKASLDLASTHQPFGIGAGNARHYLWRDHAHNALIEWYLTAGFLGLLGVGALYVGAVQSVVRWWNPAPGGPISRNSRYLGYSSSLSAILYLAANLSSDSLGPGTTPVLWLLIGLSTVTSARPTQGEPIVPVANRAST
jgi:O-antigen ligase